MAYLLGDAEVLESESEASGGGQSCDGCDKAVQHALLRTESRVRSPLAQRGVRGRHQADLVHHSNPRLERLQRVHKTQMKRRKYA